MIEVQRRGRVARITLQAPPVNVLDGALLEELSAELARLRDDTETAAVVLAGDGKCFSAGASVEEHRPEHAAAMVAALTDACLAVAGHPAPVVATVHGACLGGALELVSFCDFVVADPGASFGQPEIKLAFFPPLACERLPLLVGAQNAAYLVLTGDTVDAERAQAMGLVQRVLPRERWGELEEQLGSLSAPVLRLSKQALRLGGQPPDRARLEKLKTLFLGPLYEIEDVAEGIASFGERRRPAWKHR